jgi:hypothetical protein
MKTLQCFAGLSLMTALFAAAVVDVSGNQPAATSYSLAIPRGFSSVANHLNHGENTVAEVLTSVPEGTLLYKLDSIRGVYTVNQFQSGAWLRPKETLAPGQGALIRNPGNEFSITFTGSKPSNTQFPKLNGYFDLISLPAPGETSLPPALGGHTIYHFSAPSGFTVHTFDSIDNDWAPRLRDLTKFGASFFYLYNHPQSPNPPVISGGAVYFSTHLSDAGITNVSESSSQIGNVWRAVDARVKWGDGTGIGAGFTAQLYGGPAGTPATQLVPLTPATTFQTQSAALAGYVNPVVVTVPGVNPGASAALIMRVFDGTSYESSPVRGESNPITVKLGGPLFPLPGNLTGLQSFSLPLASGGRSQISAERIADGLRLTYTGTLQSADAVAGPYADVTGAASPANINLSGTAKFYRLKP